MFQTKVVEGIKIHILCSITFFRKSYYLREKEEDYGRARQVTDDFLIRRVRFSCCITKNAHTHSTNVPLTAFSSISMVFLTRLTVTFYVN